jgi:hypothetical protein
VPTPTPTQEQLRFAAMLCRRRGLPDAPMVVLRAVLAQPIGSRMKVVEEMTDAERRYFRSKTPAGRLGLLIEEAANCEREWLWRQRIKRRCEQEM